MLLSAPWLSMAESNGGNIRLMNPVGNLLFGLPEETKKTIR